MVSAIKKTIKKKFPYIVPPIKLGIGFVRKQISKAHAKRLIKDRSEIYLELGAGEKAGTGKWVTLDMTKSCDLYWDINKGIPFPNESLTQIYSSHFFEHFTYKEAQKILDECLRVLVPGGVFSICVPNARIYIDAYVNNMSLDKDLFFSGWKRAYNNTTKMDYVNYVAYMDEHHKYMFDEENLLHILNSKGFANVRLRKFNPAIDRKVRDHESIYAEANKRKEEEI